MTVDRDDFLMRVPCPKCGHDRGKITERSGQDVVRCLSCDRHCYNAPRTETGQGNEPMPLRVAVAVLRARISWRDREAKK